MGMFDYVVCDYKLPLTKVELSQLAKEVDWENMEFQTKSFAEWSCLEHFSIEEDGQLYKKTIEYEENDDEENDDEEDGEEDDEEDDEDEEEEEEDELTFDDEDDIDVLKARRTTEVCCAFFEHRKNLLTSAKSMEIFDTLSAEGSSSSTKK